jgi:rhamnosyltransferase
MPELLGLVVLYHPDDGIIQRVRTYINEVSALLVVDNSEPSSSVVSSLKELGNKVTVVSNSINTGIAHALNQGVGFGLSHGFEWILTMDQDSEFEAGALSIMKEFVKTAGKTQGIVAPFHHTPGAQKPDFNSATKDLRITMTSGNLLNLRAARDAGSFDEKLFIDSVDHDFCLRLRRKGYRITQINDAVLHHNLGNIRYTRILGLRIKTSNHPAVRRYYMTRNRLYVMMHHFSFDIRFFRREFTELTKSFLAVAFVEEDKGQKLKAMMKGVWHFITGRYGKI